MAVKSASKVVLHMFNIQSGLVKFLGFFESLSWSENFILEEKRGIGDEVTQEIVTHGKNAISFNWNNAYLDNRSLKEFGMVPSLESEEFLNNTDGWNLRISDRTTGTTLWMLKDLKVSGFTVNLAQMTSIGESGNGLGLYSYDVFETGA